jgi:integrase
LPRKPSRKRYPILYPREDVQLLGCADVPLVFRVFYGVAHREGMRRSELLALRWCDLDLDAGTITCDVNKTALPRFWKLAPGVASALRSWRSQQGELAPDARVFELSKDQVTRAAAGHLQTAKLERADLYSRGPGKGAFGVHCFRRSFVTRSLALGKNEDFVRQRTGHLSSQLLTYRMAACSLAELELSDLEPLERAIPELAPIAPVLPRHQGTTGAGVVDMAAARARRLASR